MLSHDEKRPVGDGYVVAIHPNQMDKLLILSRRWHWGLASLLLLGCAASLAAWVALAPPPALHPSLDDALSGGFNLLVGQAPFETHLWVDHAAGYQQAWDLAGAAQAAGGGPDLVVRFEQPGVYYASVRLSA